MKGFREKVVASKFSSKNATDSLNKSSSSSDFSEPGSSNNKLSKASLWSSFFASTFSVFETYRESSDSEKKTVHSRNNGWASFVKKFVGGGSMKRIQERVLGTGKTGLYNTTSDVWLLGVSYKISRDESFVDASTSNGLAAFMQDFSSRILMTYRKGFDPIGDSKLTSDVNWGCMLRSSQMLIAQAVLFHHLGRSWRKPLHMPLDQAYVEILHCFGDSQTLPFSIHNLLQAGKVYGLAPGSWVGPYAMCRSWEALALPEREETSPGYQSLPMAVYVVSGDEAGERGGAPVVCIEDVSRHCLKFSKGQADWTPTLLMVPLVLGVDKVNPRYIPSLQATFTFPQSLGILGGRPGASTYIIGVQDNNAIYLDPHEVQPVVNIVRDDVEADTSSYHSDVVRHISLDSLDSSLAIGFYCRDKDDFDHFCSLASKLADESNGAPLFTVTQSRRLSKPVGHGDTLGSIGDVEEDNTLGVSPMSHTEGHSHEDDWQLL